MYIYIYFFCHLFTQKFADGATFLILKEKLKNNHIFKRKGD